MHFDELMTLFSQLIERVPAGHWIIPLLLLLLIARFVFPRLNFVVKLEAGDSAKKANRKRTPPRARGKIDE